MASRQGRVAGWIRNRLILALFCLAGILSVILALPGSSFKRFRLLDGAAWKQLGPQGGDIKALVYNPQNLNEIFAVTNTNPAQVFKSSDVAQTWEKISSVDSYAYDMVLHPFNPATIYILYGSGVYKSTDSGLTWISTSFGSHNYSTGGQLTIHPFNPDILLAVGYAYESGRYYIAVHKSSNGGQTWTSRRLSEQADVAFGYSIALSLSSANIMYASGYYSKGSLVYYKIFKSTDNGDSWSDVSGGIQAVTSDLVVDPNNSSKVYAGTEWGVYRSSDGGLTWNKNLGTALAHALGIDPGNSNILYAGYSKRCFKSTDGGNIWSECSRGLKGTCNQMIVISNQVFYVSNVGIYKSVNGGAFWEESQTGIHAAKIAALGTAVLSPSLLFAEVAGDGFLKSTDSGTTWQRLPDFDRCESITRIWVNPAYPDEIIVLAGRNAGHNDEDDDGFS